MCSIRFFSMVSENEIMKGWAQILEGLPEPAAAYGPEYVQDRPRAGESYFFITDEEGIVLGMLFMRKPAPGTLTFGLGIYPVYRSSGLAPKVRDAVLEFAFTELKAKKVETEIYTSNGHSLHTFLKEPRMRIEGRQKSTIRVGDRPYDRILFGLEASEFEVAAWRKHTEQPCIQATRAEADTLPA